MNVPVISFRAGRFNAQPWGWQVCYLAFLFLLCCAISPVRAAALGSGVFDWPVVSAGCDAAACGRADAPSQMTLKTAARQLARAFDRYAAEIGIYRAARLDRLTVAERRQLLDLQYLMSNEAAVWSAIAGQLTLHEAEAQPLLFRLPARNARRRDDSVCNPGGRGDASPAGFSATGGSR